MMSKYINPSLPKNILDINMIEIKNKLDIINDIHKT